MNIINELWEQIDSQVGEDEVCSPEEQLDVNVSYQIGQLLTGNLDSEVCDEIRELEASLNWGGDDQGQDQLQRLNSFKKRVNFELEFNQLIL